MSDEYYSILEMMMQERGYFFDAWMMNNNEIDLVEFYQLKYDDRHQFITLIYDMKMYLLRQKSKELKNKSNAHTDN